jgi:deoxyribodipyrimidine photo-lyase
MSEAISIFWFRRDLRVEDNAALYHALREGKPVLPFFLFDRNILDEFPADDRRVNFIYRAIERLHIHFTKAGVPFKVVHGYPEEAFRELMKQDKIVSVYTNHDYERYAIDRDEKIRALLEENQISFHTYKDQVIFEKEEILKPDGHPYSVFTPYSKRWKSLLNEFYLKSYPTQNYFNNFHTGKAEKLIGLNEMGFVKTDTPFPSTEPDEGLLRDYHRDRDFPGLGGTSRLGIHLRFGTISIRTLTRSVRSINEIFLNELIWREFYQMIIWNFPHVNEGKCFRLEFEAIKWRNNQTEFERWCNGETGYPLVDAGMRELNETGFMHNRVRMVTASFLSKHLLIDWRWGEAYFASKLLDFEFASNNGGWQWAAGCGCDAAPYFRIFNPTLQAKKFDPEFKYIRRWVPEFEDFGYPKPIVQHELARERCLDAYRVALSSR